MDSIRDLKSSAKLIWWNAIRLCYTDRVTLCLACSSVSFLLLINVTLCKIKEQKLVFVSLCWLTESNMWSFGEKKTNKVLRNVTFLEFGVAVCLHPKISAEPQMFCRSLPPIAFIVFFVFLQRPCNLYKRRQTCQVCTLTLLRVLKYECVTVQI